MTACGSCLRPAAGSLQLNLEIMARPHMTLIHPGLSTLLLMEYASADKVDRTTRDIFLEVQFSGVIGAGLFLLRSLFVAQINVP